MSSSNFLVRTVLALGALVGLAPFSPAQQAEQPPARIAKLDLRDVRLDDACRLLADPLALNLVPTSDAAERRVSVYMRDIDAMSALRALCEAHGLWFRLDERTRVVRISTVEDYRRDLADLRAERTEFFTLLYPNATDVGQAIANLFGERVSLRTSQAFDPSLRELIDRLRRFDILDSRTQGIGQQFGGQNTAFGGRNNAIGGFGFDPLTGGGAFGGASDVQRSQFDALNQFQGAGEVIGGTPQGGANSQQQTLTPEQISELERRLAEGEGSESSGVNALVNGQARIFVTVARRQNTLIVRTSDEHALEQIRDVVAKLDVPTSLVLLEVRVLSIDLVDGMNSFFEYQWANDGLSGEFSTGTIAGPTAPALGAAGTGLRAGDLIFQFIDNNFGARMQALERDDRVRAIASPVLLTANNEVSRLFVGREVPLNRSFSGGQVFQNQNTTTTVAGSTNIEFRPVGTTLLITPSINADRTVTLRIVQETSDVDSSATVLVPDDAGFAPQTVSVVRAQTVSGTIVAKSDKAVVFGGLIEERMTDNEARTPILGDLPIVGVFFKRKEKQDTRREIVIVVRPFVLTTPAEAEASSRALLETLGTSFERVRFGEAESKDSSSFVDYLLHGLNDEDPK